MKRKNTFKIIMFTCLLLLLPFVVKATETLNTQKYVTKNGETNTIYWAAGIDGPKMPSNQEELEGDNILKYYQEEINGGKYEYYKNKYYPGHGWYDINKIMDGTDTYKCYAVSAANLTHWWLDQNSKYIDRYIESNPTKTEGLVDPNKIKDYRKKLTTQKGLDSEVYKLFREVFIQDTVKGFYPDFVMDFFINGYSKNPNRDAPNSPKDFVPNAKGGFFYPVFGKDIITKRDLTATIYDELSNNLKRYIIEGNGICLTYKFSNISTHAITLWGAEYDKNDNLVAVYITDSDDTTTALPNDTELQAMQRYPVYKDSIGHARISTKINRTINEGSEIYSLFLLSLGEDQWQRYFNEKVTIEIPVANKGLVYTGDELIGINEGRGYTLSGKASAILPGEYTATLNLKDGYIWADGTNTPKNILWKIDKAKKEKPKDIIGNYGEILNTSEQMEYSTDIDFKDSFICKENITTHVPEGIYYVRYKETETHFPSESVKVVVKGKKIKSIELMNTNYKKEYFIGDLLDTTNLKLIVNMEDGSQEEVDVEKEMISGFDSSKKNNNLILTINYKNFKTEYSVRIINKPIPWIPLEPSKEIIPWLPLIPSIIIKPLIPLVPNIPIIPWIPLEKPEKIENNKKEIVNDNNSEQNETINNNIINNKNPNKEENNIIYNDESNDIIEDIESVDNITEHNIEDNIEIKQEKKTSNYIIILIAISIMIVGIVIIFLIKRK